MLYHAIPSNNEFFGFIMALHWIYNGPASKTMKGPGRWHHHRCRCPRTVQFWASRVDDAAYNAQLEATSLRRGNCADGWHSRADLKAGGLLIIPHFGALHSTFCWWNLVVIFLSLLISVLFVYLARDSISPSLDWNMTSWYSSVIGKVCIVPRNLVDACRGNIRKPVVVQQNRCAGPAKWPGHLLSIDVVIDIWKLCLVESGEMFLVQPSWWVGI